MLGMKNMMIIRSARSAVVAPMLALLVCACDPAPGTEDGGPPQGSSSEGIEEGNHETNDQINADNTAMVAPVNNDDLALGFDPLDGADLTEEQKDVVRGKTMVAMEAVGRCIQNPTQACRDEAEDARADLEATIRTMT